MTELRIKNINNNDDKTLFMQNHHARFIIVDVCLSVCAYINQMSVMWNER